DMSDDNKGAVFGTDNRYSRPGISISRYSNTSITWEKATKTNLGIDMELFHHWDFTADVYKQIRSNILMRRAATPAELGLSAQPQANIGKAEGRGVDLALVYNQAFPNTLWIQGRANFTFAQSEFLVYEEYDYKDAPWKSHIGNSVN